MYVPIFESFHNELNMGIYECVESRQAKTFFLIFSMDLMSFCNINFERWGDKDKCWLSKHCNSKVLFTYFSAPNKVSYRLLKKILNPTIIHTRQVRLVYIPLCTTSLEDLINYFHSIKNDTFHIYLKR